MSSPLLEAYQTKQSKLIAQACAWQTLIALLLGTAWYNHQGKFTSSLHEFGILSILVSLPTVAGFFAWRLRLYASKGWRKDCPKWDLNGEWAYTVSYSIKPLIRLTTAQSKLLNTAFSRDEKGKMIVQQTVWELTISEAEGILLAGQLTQSWHALSSNYDPARQGFAHIFYNLTFFPEGLGLSQRMEGVEHMRISDRDSQQRPTAMKSTFSSCAQCEGVEAQFIVSAHASYRRLSF